MHQDLAKALSLEEIKDALKLDATHTHTHTHAHTHTQDLAGALSLEEIKDALKLDAIQNRHWQIVSCSAVRSLQKRKIKPKKGSLQNCHSADCLLLCSLVALYSIHV
jgi:hypothetical protein